MSTWDDLSSDFGLDCGGCERCHHGAGDQCPSVEVDDLRKRVAELEAALAAQDARVVEVNAEADRWHTAYVATAARERDEARRLFCVAAAGLDETSPLAIARQVWGPEVAAHLYPRDDEGQT